MLNSLFFCLKLFPRKLYYSGTMSFSWSLMGINYEWQFYHKLELDIENTDGSGYGTGGDNGVTLYIDLERDAGTPPLFKGKLALMRALKEMTKRGDGTWSGNAQLANCFLELSALKFMTDLMPDNNWIPNRDIMSWTENILNFVYSVYTILLLNRLNWLTNFWNRW